MILWPLEWFSEFSCVNCVSFRACWVLFCSHTHCLSHIYIFVLFFLTVGLSYPVGVWCCLSIFMIEEEAEGCCCCCSITQSCPTLCDPLDCSTPGFPVLHYLLEFAQTRVHCVMMPSNHLILCHPLLLLPSVLLSIDVGDRWAPGPGSWCLSNGAKLKFLSAARQEQCLFPFFHWYRGNN